MKVVKSSCAGKKKVRTCTFKPQVNIKNKREPIQTQEDINATHSEAKLQDLINEIKSNIYTKVKAVATSYEFGFDENEVDDYFFVEASATEIGEDHHEAIRVEVRGEVSYEGLEDLIEALDPIIESYDSYAYFEPVEPGIIEAYVSVDQVDMSIYGATASPDHMFYDYHGKRFSIHDNSSELRDDVIEDVYYLWKASISQQAGAYNDADEDYVYAFIRGQGVVEYYKKGKYVATSNYNLRDEGDFEQAWEYMEIILQDVCDRLIAYNKDVPDRMVYNSTSVEATEDLTDLPENFQHAYTLAKNDFMNDYKNAHVNVQIDPDDPYAEEGEISVYLSGFNPYGKKCARHIYINDSLDSDTIYQALKNTAEDVGIRKGHYDIQSSVYSSDTDDRRAEDDPWIEEIEWAMSQLPAWFKVQGGNLDYNVTYNGQTVHVEFFLSDGADYTYTIDGEGPYSTNQSERIGSDIEDYINEKFEDIMSATEEYDEEELQDIIDELTADGFDVTDEADLLMGLGADLGMDRADARYYAELILNHMYDSSVLGAEEDEDSLPMVDQEYDSAATSINSNKLPAIYKMVNFNEGDIICDFGGGKFDNAVEYIKDKGATLVVYDPYNRSAEHNREVLKILRENGGADAAVNSNVLNVIKEPEARKNVLENIARITKPGAPIYITVYEGRGNGQEGPTKSGYQLNRKTADYLEEIQEVFPDATRRGKLITAHNSGSIASSQDITAEYNIQFKRSVIDELRPLLVEKLESKYGIEFFVTDMFIEGDDMHIQVYGDDKYHGDIDIPVDYSFDIWDLLEDAFNKFQELFDGKSSSPVKSYTDVEEDISRYDKDVDRYHMMVVKPVEDSDGFLTEYAMYEVRLSDGSIEYECYLGDRDLYGPWNGEGLDFESDRYDEAAEWWNDYNGVEVDDITSSTILDANPEFRNNFEEAVDFFYEDYPATVELTDEVDEEYDTLYKAYVKETGSLYQKTPGIVYIDINWDSGEILQALQETAEAIGIEQYPDDDIEMSTFSDKNDVTSSTIKASYDGKFTCRIDHYGAFDNGHVLHGDWKKMSNEQAELLAKQYSENDPETIYYVHYDNIMDPASDYVWYQGEPYMSGDLVYRGGSVDVKGVPVSEDEVLSYTSVQADYNDKNLRASEDEWLTPPEYDDPIEHEDSEELIEVEINQVITVDVDGDYEWDDDTYVWASPNGSNEEWRSEDGVYIDDKVGVVEHIDDLIIPNVPTRPGKYRVTGSAELVYDVSGIQEYRTEYGPDDYDSDIDIDHAVVSFNFRKSEVQNLKITPVRR